jgi:hypothetical protein
MLALPLKLGFRLVGTVIIQDIGSNFAQNDYKGLLWGKIWQRF